MVVMFFAEKLGKAFKEVIGIDYKWQPLLDRFLYCVGTYAV